MEIYKDIKDYEGLYQVSNYGNVKALKREFLDKRGNIKRYPERILKWDITDMGSSKYARVTLSKGHKTKRFSVHRLVAETFIPNTDNKPFVNHIDNNGLNNNVSNLEWVTHSENMIHAQKQGRLFASQSKGGKKIGKISRTKAVQRCRDMIGNRYGQWEVIDYYGIKSKSKHYVLCKCHGCGIIKPVSAETIRNNKSKACSLKCRKKLYN